MAKARSGFEERKTGILRARIGAAQNRLSARLAAATRPATGFTSQPEPRTIGSFARGRQLIAGNFQFAGFLIEGKGLPIWDLPMPDKAFEETLHGMAWLDDLAAVGDREARARAQDWVFAWIARHGKGTGPGWTPDLTGRRMVRLINHAILLLNGRERTQADAFFRTLAQQTIFLAKRWKAASPGLPRFEALTGLVAAGLALQGMERHVAPAMVALGHECARHIDPQGAIPTRNPEELLEVMTLLVWTKQALEEAGQKPNAPLHDAIERIAPTLRALRHVDGGLARFHGGGRGLDGRLDQALAIAETRDSRHDGLAMGFARLHTLRTSLIVDASAPPKGAASANAHASTLAFEMTCGRHPLIVNCGSGAVFGREWHRAGRATPSHSTLAIEGYSSSRFGPARAFGASARTYFEATPHEVWHRVERPDGLHLIFGHDGYIPTHGMTHIRELELSQDGRSLRGQDTLGAMSVEDRHKFDELLLKDPLNGIPFTLRFHLHPEADAQIDMGGAAVSVVLKSGDLWLFRHDGVGELSLEPSVYLEKGRLRPRASLQIVLKANVFEHICQIGWTLSSAQATPSRIPNPESDTPLSKDAAP